MNDAIFEWKEHTANGIEGNPLDCWWCEVPLGTSNRMYQIVPQYPTDKNGTRTSDEPELYVLFETLRSEGEKTLRNGALRSYFVKACRTMDEAKSRAELQWKNIKSIIDSYFSSGK